MREITYANAIKEALSEEMRRDQDIVFIGEDIGPYGGVFGVTKGVFEEFGKNRVKSTPISEIAITGAAAGAAMTGLRTVLEIMFIDFMCLAMEPLVNQAAKNRFMFGGQAQVPMTIRTASGTGIGAAAQHSQSLEAWLVHVPGLKVVAPSTPYDAKGLLKAAIRDNNPVVFVEQKILYRQTGLVPELGDDYIIPIGKADIKREGRDVSIITYGTMVHRSLAVAEKFAKEGVEIEVVDIRSLNPLDKETIVNSVKKTGKVLIVHEACQTGGFGGELAAVIGDSDAIFHLDGPIKRLGGLDVPIPYSPVLEKQVIPTEESITAALKEIL